MASSCKPLPLGYAGPHPLALVMRKLIEHVTGDGQARRHGANIEDKCCRPFRGDSEEQETPPEGGFIPGARRTWKTRR